MAHENTAQTDRWMLTRRAFVGSMAAGAAAFAAFGPRGERQVSDGRIVLDYWEKWTRHEGDAMVRIVDAFNASQDRIRVRYLVTSDIGQKSLVAIAGGNPPDLIGLYAFNVPPYAESRAIMSLDELAPKFGLSLDRYAQGVHRVMMHQGKWWSVVNTAGSVALYYNKAAFRDAGLDPDGPPRTLAELDAFHARLIKRKADGELERVGFLHREPGWWSWLWAYHFGGHIYNEAMKRATLDSTENIRALEWMQSYSRDLGVEQVKRFVEGFGNYFTPENPFLTGKVAMIIQGPWIANLINTFKPDLEYGVCPLPCVTPLRGDPVGLIDTDVIVIPRGAKHPEACMEFIAFTQRRENVEALATAHCKPSPLVETSEVFLAQHPNRGIRVHYDLLRSRNAYVPPRTPVWQQFKDEFDTAVQRLWRLEAKPAVAMSVLQSRVQGLIDRDAERRRRRYGTSTSEHQVFRAPGMEHVG
jgi:ABC-type glycerol-3-phosphate transport system substrate-binding protein